jgi:hypothetical protein
MSMLHSLCIYRFAIPNLSYQTKKEKLSLATTEKDDGGNRGTCL